MCSPPLLLPELLKVIKHSEISEKKEKKRKQNNFIKTNCQIKF